MENEKEKINVQLTAFDWHLLLQELEHSMGVVNRERTHIYQLWEKIASQLSGKNINLIINGADVLDENHEPRKEEDIYSNKETTTPRPELHGSDWPINDDKVKSKKWWFPFVLFLGFCILGFLIISWL
jgi:hypothetical protein